LKVELADGTAFCPDSTQIREQFYENCMISLLDGDGSKALENQLN